MAVGYDDLDNVPTKTAGVSPVLASDWNTYVQGNFDSLKRGHVSVADAAARTALTVAAGTMVFQADDKRLYVFDGSSWEVFSDSDLSANASFVVAPKDASGTPITNVTPVCSYRLGAGMFSVVGYLQFTGLPAAFSELHVNLPYVNTGWPFLPSGAMYPPNYGGYVWDSSTGAVYDLVFNLNDALSATLDSSYWRVGYRSSTSAVANVTSTVPFTFTTNDVIVWYATGHTTA